MVATAAVAIVLAAPRVCRGAAVLGSRADRARRFCRSGSWRRWAYAGTTGIRSITDTIRSTRSGPEAPDEVAVQFTPGDGRPGGAGLRPPRLLGTTRGLARHRPVSRPVRAARDLGGRQADGINLTRAGAAATTLARSRRRSPTGSRWSTTATPPNCPLAPPQGRAGDSLPRDPLDERPLRGPPGDGRPARRAAQCASCRPRTTAQSSISWATVEKNRAWPLAIGFLERDEARGVFPPDLEGGVLERLGPPLARRRDPQGLPVRRAKARPSASSCWRAGSRRVLIRA